MSQYKTNANSAFIEFSRISGPFAMLIGVTALAGWAFEIPMFKSIDSHWISMAVNTAFSFILLGVSLSLTHWQSVFHQPNKLTQSIAYGCIFVALLLGMGNLLEYIFGWQINMHELLFKAPKDAVGTLAPNRMALTTAINFVLLGLSLLFLNHRNPKFTLPMQYLALTSGFIGFLTLTAYLYGIPPRFDGLAFYTQMAANTAFSFVLLSLGVLFAKPDVGLMEIVTSKNAGGMIIRRLLPAIFIITLVSGWLVLGGAQVGFYNISFGISLLILSIIVIFVCLVFSISETIHRLEKQKEEVRQELRESDTQLRHQLDFTKTITANLGEGLYALDVAGNFTFLNPPGEQLLGWSEADILGKSMHDLIHHQLANGTPTTPEACPILNTMQSGQLYRAFEDVFIQKNGYPIPVSYTATPIVSEGRIAGCLCIFQDITERKSMENQLIQSQKMESIGFLAAGIAHEINNPVGFVMSNLRTLEKYVARFKNAIEAYDALLRSSLESESTPDSENVLAQIQEIEKKNKLAFILNDTGNLLQESLDGVERVKEIVQGLKSFSRVDEGQIQEANINECIETTLKVVWNELKYTTQVHKQLGELPLIRCYPGQLNQVFMNLLVNAAQAIPKQGDITIETSITETHVVICITDTGEGIPPESLTNIFTPFYTTKPVGKGTGLGLSISYNIIQKHQGTIEVESKLGEGTRFTIRLPIQGIQHDAE